MEEVNSLEKLDKNIKSINDIKATQNKLIISVNAFRDDKKLLDKKFSDIDGKLDIISKQFDEILANNISLTTKIEHLESKVTQLEVGSRNSTSLNQEHIFAEISDRQSRSRNIILFNIPETPVQPNSDDKTLISNIFKKIDLSIEPINIIRLGKTSNKCRPIRATLPNLHDVYDVLKNKRKLLNSVDFKLVSISTDRTLF